MRFFDFYFIIFYFIFFFMIFFLFDIQMNKLFCFCMFVSLFLNKKKTLTSKKKSYENTQSIHYKKKYIKNSTLSANVELELSSPNVHVSQNLIDTSVASSNNTNDLHGMNNATVSSSYESQQQSSHQHAQPLASGKKESHLLSWFTSSTSTSTSSAMNNTSVISTSSSSAITASPPTIAHRFNPNESEQSMFNPHDAGGSSSPSMKINSKLSYGEKFISKFNKNGNKATSTTTSEQQAASSASNVEQTTSSTGKQETQQKSSRRTTSLLNLFMSNSQGNILHFQKKTLTSFSYKHFLSVFKFLFYFPIQFSYIICSFFFLSLLKKSYLYYFLLFFFHYYLGANLFFYFTNKLHCIRFCSIKCTRLLLLYNFYQIFLCEFL